MTTLIVSTILRGTSTTFATVTASFDGAGQVGPDSTLLEQSFFTMPQGTTDVEISVQSLAGDAFSVTGTFTDDGLGGLEPSDAPAEFEPPTLSSFGGNDAILITAHLGELRDATTDSVASLQPPPGRAGVSPPSPITAWAPAPVFASGSVIQTPCLSGSTLQVTSQQLSASGEMLVLERLAGGPPTRVAVFWPFDVSRDPDAEPTPFLYYFHPTVAQAAEVNKEDSNSPYYVNSGDNHDPTTHSTYPNGYDYNYFGLWRYLHYSDDVDPGTGDWLGDPLRGDWFWKGLPYQVEASGKPVVTVIAMNKVAGNPCDELSSLTDASALQQLLLDVQAFMFRRETNYSPPGLGRLAMASFSSGRTTLSCFLSRASNHNHPLYTDTLQEVYLFDPHADLASELTAPVANTLAWLASGTVLFPPTKVARLYTQISPTALAPVLSQLGLPPAKTPFDTSIPFNSNISVTCLPLLSVWANAAPGVFHNTGQVHQAIPALMLTDALRRSHF